MAFATERPDDVTSQHNYGANACNLDHSCDQQSVFSGRRIVVKAEEENAVGKRAHVLVRSFDEREPDIARRVFDSRKIARHFAGRCENHDRARMCELPRRFVVSKTIADTVRELVDRGLVAG